ncbi:MAG: GNAT family N-acetyltransferase [Sutterellaceae bacterium]|nr:GNAT family N-acetyltransferase [Sutterellaceae bacterium]
MTDLTLRLVADADKSRFIADIQAAFQKGYEDVFGPYDKPVLPVKDIEESFAAKGAQAFFAVLDGEIVGGALVVINELTQHNHLDLLYVGIGCEGRGVGTALWQALEAKFPATRVWETFTPYFEKRNIHFYVNKLGFKVVEFFNKNHRHPEWTDDVGGMPPEVGCDFLRFEKVMKS